VARSLFARRGFQGTTTRQIAQRAWVNEAIIFRHFPHKEDLYWAIIDDMCRGARGHAELCNKLGTDGDDRELFAAIAEDILHRNTADSTFTRLALFTALENHRLSQRFFRTYVAQYYERLARHIRRRIREGSFRRTDPLVAARGFIGMVFYHFLIQELFGARGQKTADPKRVSRTVTDIWFDGMAISSLGRVARAGRVRKRQKKIEQLPPLKNPIRQAL
jgi:AcrR family transcriptional regulator